MKRPDEPPVSPSSSPLQVPSSDGWCEVRAHNRVMRYRRAGMGSVILMLGVDSLVPIWPELPRLLTTQFRTIVPDLPQGVDDAAEWLSSLLDGLGIGGAAVLAAEPYRATALELAVADRERVRQVVLVHDGSGAAAIPDPNVPLLLLPRHIEADHALALTSRFLRTANPSPSSR